MTRLNRGLLALTTLLVAGCSSLAPPSGLTVVEASDGALPFARLEFIAALEPGDSTFDPGFGGLSGLVWDPDRAVLLAVSDDSTGRTPARFYEIDLDLPVNGDGSWVPTRQVDLRSPDGQLLPPGSTEGEGIALLGDELVIATEGTGGFPPFLRLFDRDGRQVRVVDLPDYLIPGKDRGVRINLGLETTTTLPSGVIFTGLENALTQDGPAAGVDTPSPARILRFDSRGRRQEFVYWTDPVVDPPKAEGDFHTNGLVSLLALDGTRLLALERSYTLGLDNGIRLYLVDLSRADDVAGEDALPAGVLSVDKRLLADLSRLDFNLDNVEGMTWGPDLADGRRSLLLVSDNNFNPEQTTHLLVFAVSDEAADISEIQGAGHRSPLEAAWLFGIEGTVTQVRRSEEGISTAWIQGEDDGDPSTSAGLRVLFDAEEFDLDPGRAIRADGYLFESGRGGQLPVTTLWLHHAEDLGPAALPQPVRLDPLGVDAQGFRAFPNLPLDDDGMASFDPTASAMDLLESLEGMRIELPSTTAVSGTSSFGEITLLPDGAEGLRSPTGGVVLTPDSFNPQRLIAIGGPDQPSPDVRVGDRFEEPVSGILDYSFANYKLVVDVWLEVTRRQPVTPTVPWLTPDSAFTFATYNVLNLDPEDGQQFDLLAESIATGLRSPDVLALQEIQDDNGPDDEGVTSAHQTLTMLIEAIAAAGGPEYRYAQIDPIHDGEGGQPVGNIRVAFLYRTDRVQLIRRGNGDAWTSTEIAADGSFSLSPGRVAVHHPAFAGDEARGWGPNRRCLAAAFTVVDQRLGFPPPAHPPAGVTRDESHTGGGESAASKRHPGGGEGGEPGSQPTGQHWQFINCHLKSKRGDDRLFGDHQPPVFHTEVQRSAQAEVLASMAGRVLEADPEAHLVVLGDTNEHEFRRPIRILAAGELTNLVEQVPQADRYTYNFNGNSQILDNVLVSPAIMACQPETAIVHWNTDVSDAERASDHDPVVVRVPECGAESVSGSASAGASASD